MVRGSFYQRLSGFYFCYFAFIGAFAPYFALYLKSLGYSAAEIGMLLAVNPVARIFGPNLWGWLSDHYRARGQLIRRTPDSRAGPRTRPSSDHPTALPRI